MYIQAFNGWKEMSSNFWTFTLIGIEWHNEEAFPTLILIFFNLALQIDFD